MITILVFILMLLSCTIIGYSMSRIIQEYKDGNIPLSIFIILGIGYIATMALIIFAVGVSDLVQEYLNKDVVILYTNGIY